MVDAIDLDKITIQQLSLPLYNEKNVTVSVLRLDLIHPLISGNKWFKLRFYLEEAKQLNKKTIITFGGAWSNHILATASAAQLYGFKSIGLIRGEEPLHYSTVLSKAKQMDMQLHFLDRDSYRSKVIPASVLDKDSYLINEGGYGVKGAEGAATIMDHCQPKNYSHFAAAAGTGTMLAGLSKKISPDQVLAGIPVLKNNHGLEEQIKKLANKECQPVLFHDYHFGGYAKYTPELIRFMNTFYAASGIPTDFVYTGKLFFGLHGLLEKNFFPAGSKLLIIHSGGLTGNQSLDKGTLIF